MNEKRFEPPRDLWHVIGIVEEVALKPPQSSRARARSWLAQFSNDRPGALIECFEVVVVTLDYVKDVLTTLAEERGDRAAVAPIRLGAPSRRRKIAQLVEARVGSGREPRRPASKIDLVEDVTASDLQSARWAVRECLGLVETAIAAAGTGSADEAIARRAHALDERDLRRLVAAAELLEAAAAHTVIQLSRG